MTTEILPFFVVCPIMESFIFEAVSAWLGDKNEMVITDIVDETKTDAPAEEETTKAE